MRELPILMNGQMMTCSSPVVDRATFISRYPSTVGCVLGESKTLQTSANISICVLSGEFARRAELPKGIALIRSQLGAIHG